MVDGVRRLPDDGGERRNAQQLTSGAQEGDDQDYGHAELEAADVADEVLVVRSVRRHPGAAEARKGFPERAGRELRPGAYRERRDKEEQKADPQPGTSG